MVYRKITRRLVPFLFLCYAAAYLDRVNIGFAKLQPQDDLQFSDTVYGLGAAMFFVGYIIFEVPSTCCSRRSARADRRGERRWHTTIPCLVTGVWLIATAVSLECTVLAVASMVLVAAGVSTAQAAFWAIPAGFLTGTYAAAGIALINSIGNIGGAVSTSLVGVLSDLTGSTAASLYPFGIVLVVGGLLVLLVPRSVNDTAAEPITRTRA